VAGNRYRRPRTRTGGGAARPEESWPAKAAAAYGSLGRSGRLATLGALICAGSLLFPWYRAPFSPDLVRTGLGSFGFATAALLITLTAALVLLFELGRGRRPPLPLRDGTLLAAAGAWAALIVGFMMLDRPNSTLAGFEDDYSLAYGIFIALGGAVLLTAAGLRMRREEIAREARPPVTPGSGWERTGDRPRSR
jgi:hypothetical protein